MSVSNFVRSTKLNRQVKYIFQCRNPFAFGFDDFNSHGKNVQAWSRQNGGYILKK